MKILTVALMVLCLFGHAGALHATEGNVLHVEMPVSGESVVLKGENVKRIVLPFKAQDVLEMYIFGPIWGIKFAKNDPKYIGIVLDNLLPPGSAPDKRRAFFKDIQVQFSDGSETTSLASLITHYIRKRYPAAKEWDPAEGDSIFSNDSLPLGMPDKNARDTTLGPYPSILALYEAAKSGEAEAQYWWAERLLQGRRLISLTIGGVKETLRKDAIAMLAKAAKWGHFQARCRLALLHVNQPDSERSRQSVPGGRHPIRSDADLLLLELHEKKYDSPLNMYYLGEFYADTKGGYLNSSSARQYFAKAAMLGQPEACFALANMYSGKGSTQDEKNIAKLLLIRASELGLPIASDILAYRFKMGLPVDHFDGEITEDTVVGREWRKIWAAQDTGLAFATAGEKFLKSKKLAKAIEYLTVGSNFGNAQAQFRLGECFENGIGVAKDVNKAVELYRCAAQNDYEEAENRLKKLGK